MTAPEAAGRASPPTGRVVRVLEFMSRNPQQRFGVSELARRVELSKPTCLGIVSTLTGAGYLIRDGLRWKVVSRQLDQHNPPAPECRMMFQTW